MMGKTLKPCPFCGETNIKHYKNGANDSICECTNCGACSLASKKKNAVKIWNRRVENDN